MTRPQKAHPPRSRSRHRKAVLGLALTAPALCFALYSPIAAPALRPQPPQSDARPELEVLTFNLNFGVAGDPATIAAIEANADVHVIVLQETNAAWEQHIADRLRDDFPFQHWQDATTYPAGGAAILSRFPMDIVARSESATGWFDALSTVVHTPQGPVRVVNVHLEPVGGLRALLSISNLHAREMAEHIDAFDLRGEMPVIVAGDFNEERRGALSLLVSEGFVDAVDHFLPGVPTWRWAVGSHTMRLQLDHILHDDGLEALRVEIQQTGNSDHLPVRAAFRHR